MYVVSSHLKINFCDFIGAEGFCKNFFPGLVFKAKKKKKRIKEERKKEKKSFKQQLAS